MTERHRARSHYPWCSPRSLRGTRWNMKARSVVTLSDVAERAGVSLATASRVINGGTRAVSPHYRDRVLAAAADLGYTPNAHAQAMARGRSKMIGLVVHDIADPYFSAIAAGAISLAGSRGLLVL